jgi:hypothetical protein
MRKALESQDYELIKAHIIGPDNSPLPEYQQDLLNRIVSASKILEKNPIVKNAVAILNVKYPHISRIQAYRDVALSKKLFNTFNTFDYDFWRSWLINDIISAINRCRDNNTPADRRIMAMEHANLIKIIGVKPEELPDPQRNEKHNFYILIQNNKKEVKLNVNELDKIPVASKNELNKLLFGGAEIDDVEAEEIMQS